MTMRPLLFSFKFKLISASCTTTYRIHLPIISINVDVLLRKMYKKNFLIGKYEYNLHIKHLLCKCDAEV